MSKKLCGICGITVIVLSIILFGVVISKEKLKYEAKKANSYSLERIKKSGELIVGTFPKIEPMTYKNEDGEIIGLDIDIINNIAKLLEVKIKIKEIDFIDLFKAVENNEVDIAISAITITPERREGVLFSTPYLTSGQVILVRKEFKDIKKYEELKGFKIGVPRGTEQEKMIRRYVDDSSIVLYDDFNDASLLLDNEVDALIYDYVTALALVKHHPELKISSNILTEEYFGIAVNKKNASLLDGVDDALRKIKVDGSFDKIKDKWLSN